MAKRLIRVAKDLNVGISTLVEHLQKQGFEVENSPRAKVSDEAYNVLLRDFEKSIAIKSQADQLTIGSRIKKNEAEKKEEQDRRNHENYLARVKKEKKMAKKIEREVKNLEKQEMELIARLQSTQALQKEAYAQLESALTTPTGSNSNHK